MALLSNQIPNAKTLLGQVSDVQKSFGNYIVKPLNAFGLGGFIFDVEGSTTVSLTSEITDHYTESNNAIQDHIAIKPIKITLKNYVGELVYYKKDDNNTIIQDVTRKLTVINNYLPKLTNAAKQLKNAYQNNKNFSLSNLSGQTLLDSQSTIVNMWALIKNLTPPVQKQAQAYMFFEALFQQKILMSVQTPFKFYTNMAIESIIANQDEDSRYISDFSITLKEIRTAKVKTVKFKESEYKSADMQGRNQIQANPVGNVVKSQGEQIGQTATAPIETITEVTVDNNPKDVTILTVDELHRLPQ